MSIITKMLLDSTPYQKLDDRMTNEGKRIEITNKVEDIFKTTLELQRKFYDTKSLFSDIALMEELPHDYRDWNANRLNQLDDIKKECRSLEKKRNNLVKECEDLDEIKELDNALSQLRKDIAQLECEIPRNSCCPIM